MEHFIWGESLHPNRAYGCKFAGERAQIDTRILLEIERLLDSKAEFASSKVLSEIESSNTVIECCPVSNITLAGGTEYCDHPIWTGFLQISKLPAQ